MEGSVAPTVIVSVSSILLVILCVVICLWCRKCWSRKRKHVDADNEDLKHQPVEDVRQLHKRSRDEKGKQQEYDETSPMMSTKTIRMARQRQNNEYRTDKALKETHYGRFEEILKFVSIDYSNQEIQDIQRSVLELLTRYADKINERGKYNILRIEPCGSMVEKTAVWKTGFCTLPSREKEYFPCTEFDFLAVLERPSFLQIEKTLCQLCAKVPGSIINKTHSRRSLCCPGIMYHPLDFNDMFEKELSSAIVSSCSCYCVGSNQKPYGPHCCFHATSTQDKPGCEKCTVYTQTGNLQIDSSIKEYNRCTLTLMWTSDAMMLVAPDENDFKNTRQIKCLSILIDFLPAYEIFKPKINENELQHDCFIVPKHCVHYPQCKYTWRISSCLAEIDHIVNTMSVKHRKCFKILKYFSQRTKLPGYHLKTAVLNHSLTCTESSEDCYTCVTAIVEELKLAYTGGVLKSFSSKANLLPIDMEDDYLDYIETFTYIKQRIFTL